MCLLRGHGAVIATSELKATVMVSIGLMCNAAMLIQAHTLSQGRGDAAVKHLSPAEIEATSKILLGPLGLDRAWEYWRVRAGFREGGVKQRGLFSLSPLAGEGRGEGGSRT